MQHLDPDRLILLAFAEDSEDPGESVHLTGCAHCRGEVDSLRTVAELGAGSQELRDLPAPPAHVWEGIQAEITRPAQTAPVIDITQRRTAKRRRPWLAPLLSAAAAAVLAVVGTVGVIRLAPQQEPVAARATLKALPSVPPDARGTARVLADGTIELDIRNLPLTTGFHEVWLIDPNDTTKMLSLGNLSTTSDVTLPVPPGTDLNRYRLVDVSEEAHDGDAGHSGSSLLRGTLTS